MFNMFKFSRLLKMGSLGIRMPMSRNALLKGATFMGLSSLILWRQRKAIWMKMYDKKAYNDFLQHAVLKPQNFPWFRYKSCMIFSGNANHKLS